MVGVPFDDPLDGCAERAIRVGHRKSVDDFVDSPLDGHSPVKRRIQRAYGWCPAVGLHAVEEHHAALGTQPGDKIRGLPQDESDMLVVLLVL